MLETPGDAADLVERAGGHLKTPLLNGRRGVDAAEAPGRLAEAGVVVARGLVDGGP